MSALDRRYASAPAALREQVEREVRSGLRCVHGFADQGEGCAVCDAVASALARVAAECDEARADVRAEMDRGCVTVSAAFMPLYLATREAREEVAA